MIPGETARYLLVDMPSISMPAEPHPAFLSSHALLEGTNHAVRGHARFIK